MVRSDQLVEEIKSRVQQGGGRPGKKHGDILRTYICVNMSQEVDLFPDHLVNAAKFDNESAWAQEEVQ